MQVVHLLAVTSEEQELAEGVKSLRATLNESQQQFSHRLGVSLSTVSRYELKNPPEGDILIKLAQIASEAGRDDLASLFKARFESELKSKGEIARAIRQLRMKFGETQQAFAQRAGLSVVSIARYETNAVPSAAILQRLAELAEENGLQDEALIFKRQYIPYLSYTPEQRRRADVKLEFLRSIDSIDPERLDAIEAVLAIDSPQQLQQEQKRGRISKALDLLRSLVSTRAPQPQRHADLDLSRAVRIDEGGELDPLSKPLTEQSATELGRRLTKIRKQLSKYFPSERELTELCALAWLLESGVKRTDVDNFLIEQVFPLLLDRDGPLDKGELEALGFIKIAPRVPHLEDTITFSTAVVTLRKMLGVSRSDFAASLGVSSTLVEQIEAGNAMPWGRTFNYLDKLRRRLDEISKVIHEAHWKATGATPLPSGIRHYGDDPEALPQGVVEVEESKPLEQSLSDAELQVLGELGQRTVAEEHTRPEDLPNRELRDKRILKNIKFVTEIAEHIKKSLPPHFKLEDLISAGTMGLFGAAAKYGDRNNVAFPIYARHRIRGAMLDTLREQTLAARESTTQSNPEEAPLSVAPESQKK
jgi:transcriptional regulator with XRE-family HTH domain